MCNHRISDLLGSEETAGIHPVQPLSQGTVT